MSGTAPSTLWPMQDGHKTWVREGRLGALTAGLLVVGGVLLVLGLGTVAGAPRLTADDVARAPLDADVLRLIGTLELVLGAVATWLGLLAGLAALQTAVSMRILAARPVDTSRLGGPLRDGLDAVGPPLARLLDLEPRPSRDLPSLVHPEGYAERSVHVTVLVPAHDEEAVLGATLLSLQTQTRPPERVVVIADNCTDDTVEVARAHGVEVVRTVGNTEKKAGALNQVLAVLLPDCDDHDLVMVLDADSTIEDTFLDTALRLLQGEPDLMAVGGLFFGEEGSGLLGQLQRNEYARYQRLVSRKLDRVFVLTGTAAVIRSQALAAVAAARGDLIPGTPGLVYDTRALTEDNELTLALKSVGARLTSPVECKVTTEVMPTWRALWRQRSRWHRGALENIATYGPTRATALYWGQQLALAYGVVALWSYFALMAVSLLSADQVMWSWFWLGVGVLFLVERLATVWRAGWRARLVAAPVVLELVYAAYIQVIFVVSLLATLTRREAGWNHVARPVQALAVVQLAALGILFPSSVLRTDWYAGLSLFVAVNTLVFAALSLLHLFPPPRWLPQQRQLERRRALLAEQA